MDFKNSQLCLLSVIAITIVIFFHGRVIKIEGDLSLKHMMRLALAEIAHLTLDDFFPFHMLTVLRVGEWRIVAAPLFVS